MCPTVIDCFVVNNFCRAIFPGRSACLQEISSILNSMPKRKFVLSTWLAMRALSSMGLSKPSTSRAGMLVCMSRDQQPKAATGSRSLPPDYHDTPVLGKLITQQIIVQKQLWPSYNSISRFRLSDSTTYTNCSQRLRDIS